jgi:hypothetical protein
MIEKKLICPQCHTEFIGFSSNRKYCSIKCKDKYNNLKDPNRYKRWIEKNPERDKKNKKLHYQKNKEIYKKKSKEWQINNPEKTKINQSKAVMKYYYKNHEKSKLHLRENTWTYTHREKIFTIIGKKCKCEKEATQIHHTQYENLPRENLKEYCKYLIPLCRDCHYKIHHSIPAEKQE